MRKRTLAPLIVSTVALLSATPALAAPEPDPTPQAVKAHHRAEICPAPYERVRLRITIYHRNADGSLTFVRWYWDGPPFLVGGFDPKNCRPA